MPQRRCHIVLHSHDTMGLGHMRRTMLVAQALVASEHQPSVLLVAGARDANNFPLPPSVDCLSLPALQKDGEARYHARHLDLSLREIVALRARTIRGAIEAFEPNVFIADNATPTRPGGGDRGCLAVQALVRHTSRVVGALRPREKREDRLKPCVMSRPSDM